MEKRYYAGFRLAKDFDFIELVKEIKNNPEMKIKSIPNLFEIVEMEYISQWNSERKETGKTHYGYDFTYITIEYKGNYYYIQYQDLGGLFEVTGYKKVSPLKKQQATYSMTFENYTDLLDIINKQPLYTQPLSKTHEQQLYLLEWSGMKQKAGNREKEIINNLKDIYYTQHDASGNVIHLEAIDGSTCEYETSRRTFTN
jgi:hypothetical protein